MENNTPIPHEKRINHNLSKILNLLHDGIYISDSEGITLWVNEPYERLTGISAADVMGKSVFDLKESGVFSTIVNPEVVKNRPNRHICAGSERPQGGAPRAPRAG